MANMEAKAAELIHRWNIELAQPVSVHVVRSSDERGAALAAFLQDFTGIAKNVRILPQDGNEDELPAILPGNSVHWHAIPVGGELMPFLRTIEMQLFPMRANECLPEKLRFQIESLSVPTDLKIYVTPQCPFCPRVLSEIVPLAFINPLVHLSVIDGVLFADLAARDGIRSVPTIILDGAFRWTGAGHICSGNDWTVLAGLPGAILFTCLASRIRDQSSGSKGSRAFLQMKAKKSVKRRWKRLKSSTRTNSEGFALTKSGQDAGILYKPGSSEYIYSNYW
ncbi:MAG: thioredoxin family protein [Syntrophobacteraceae bacterium]